MYKASPIDSRTLHQEYIQAHNIDLNIVKACVPYIDLVVNIKPTIYNDTNEFKEKLAKLIPLKYKSNAL